MFKIAGLMQTANAEELSDNNGIGSWALPYGFIEQWSGDLNNGVVKIGAKTAVFHGLNSQECGLLTITRCYDYKDRMSILEIFEKAASNVSSFYYSTVIVKSLSTKQPVFCMGKSCALGSDNGSIAGVFIFPAVS
ncbi:hypothetical protein [Agrobacterium vitis]|uniref:hypothetical protein n=1 Tax=Agrobacterium vitis TaxID=373 RepID=UPI001F44C0CD|nr:hypothetical protein [Agrobacterium vitis]